MKLFVSVAALALAFAAPVMAAGYETPAAAPAAVTTTEATTTTMTADECTAALAKCADDTCKKDLEAKGCKAPEAAK